MISLDDIWLAGPKDLPYDELERAERLMAEAAHISAADRHLRGLPTYPRGKTPACGHCGESKDIWGIEFYDYASDGYPKSRWRLAVRWVCTSDDERHPYNAYQVMLGDNQSHDRTFTEFWHSHLATKVWYDLGFRRELDVADEFFQARARAHRRSLGKLTTEERKKEARIISPRTRAKILERDGFRCRRCGASAEDDRLVIDHIQPVALGGTASSENLQTLCATCNIGKGADKPHAHDLAAPEAP